MVQSRSRLRFPLEARQRLRVFGDIFWEKFESNKAMKANVLCFVNDTHPPTAELFVDAVVRESLAGERVSTWHVKHMLGWGGRQVNDGRLLKNQRPCGILRLESWCAG